MHRIKENHRGSNMTEKSLQDLQVLQSEMLATAVDLGMKIPEDLELEFSTVEVGRTTCDSLDKLIREFRAGLDQEDTSAGDAVSQDTASSARVGGSKPRKRKTTKTTTTEAAPEAQKEETTVKKPAKKSTAKKTKASKKAAKPAKKTAKKAAAPRAPRSKYGEKAKIVIVVKDPPVLKKDTKWAKRLKKVYDNGGKLVSAFVEAKGSLADLSSAVKKGLVKVA